MDQTRDFRALAEIKNGGLRCEAWKIGGVGRQAVRDRVLAFNAEGPAGLVDRKAPGNRPILTDAQRHDLMRIVESGPTPAGSWACPPAPTGYRSSWILLIWRSSRIKQPHPRISVLRPSA